MKGLNLELRCDIEMKVRECIEKSMQSNKDFNKNEAYYNAGIDEMLEIMACFWLSQLEQQKVCLKIRESIIDDEFEENVKDYFKASQSLNMFAQEFFKLGFSTGFKLAIESSKNILIMPVPENQETVNDNEFDEVEALISNIDWNDIQDEEEL